MRHLIVLGTLLFSSLSLAGISGKCVGKNNGESHFCSSQKFDQCQFFKNACEWRESEEKVAKLVIENPNKTCIAKDGMDVHENFCNKLNSDNCRVHASLCDWK